MLGFGAALQGESVAEAVLAIEGRLHRPASPSGLWAESAEFRTPGPRFGEPFRTERRVACRARLEPRTGRAFVHSPAVRRPLKDPCWCGSRFKLKRCHLDRRRLARPPVARGRVGPLRPVPDSIPRPSYVWSADPPPAAGFQIQTAESLDRLRHAGAVAADVLLEAAAAVAPGVTTDDIDAIAHAAFLARGAYPSTLGYKGFPKSVCTSVNEVICHGIPDDRPLEDGDIVNIDVTAFVDGMHGDTSATVAVGEPEAAVAHLIATTREATLRGIAAIGPGRPLNVIGGAIEPFAHQFGYGIVAEYGGHGIGETFHAAPHVHHTVRPEDGAVLRPGLSLTVEPMLTTGAGGFRLAEDGWTEVLDDGLPSAQFEHTVVVSDTGVEILTVTADGRALPGTLADL